MIKKDIKKWYSTKEKENEDTLTYRIQLAAQRLTSHTRGNWIIVGQDMANYLNTLYPSMTTTESVNYLNTWCGTTFTTSTGNTSYTPYTTNFTASTYNIVWQ